MTGSTSGVDYGVTGTSTAFEIVNRKHRLAAGLGGRPIVSSGQPMAWGAPLANALRIARLGPGADASKITLFAYESGTTWPGQTGCGTPPGPCFLPARRVGLFRADNTLTPDGWALFEAAVNFAAEPVPVALLVTSNFQEAPNDKALKERVEYAGFRVSQASGELVVSNVSAYTDGMALVVISPTVVSGQLGGALTDITVPILNAEALIHGAMKMTGLTQDTDFGIVADQWSIDVTNPHHPIGAEISGLKQMATDVSPFGWGEPGPSGTVIATTANGAHPTIFAYEKGAAMVGMNAPARRVAFFGAPSFSTSAGETVISAAVAWATGFDSDADGLSDVDEVRYGTSLSNPDTNGDGILDGAAVELGLSPTSLDMDKDGLTNAIELQKGTDPFKADTDGDGVPDNLDLFPLDPTRSGLPAGSPSDVTPPVITLTEPTNAVLVGSNP